MVKVKLNIIILLFAFAGIVFMGWGAHLREISPNFDAWFVHSVPLGEAPGSGLGAALAVSGFGVIMVGVGYFLLFAFYQATLLSYRALIVNHHLLAEIIKYVFILLISWAVIVSWGGVVSDIRWGFYMYALGEILLGASLVAVIIKTVTALKDKA